MSEKIFSGESSKDFWKAIEKAIRKTVGVDILYDYGCKAQEIEQQRDDLLEACKYAQKVFGFIAENYKSAPHFPTAERLVKAAIAKCEA